MKYKFSLVLCVVLITVFLACEIGIEDEPVVVSPPEETDSEGKPIAVVQEEKILLYYGYREQVDSDGNRVKLPYLWEGNRAFEIQGPWEEDFLISDIEFYEGDLYYILFNNSYEGYFVKNNVILNTVKSSFGYTRAPVFTRLPSGNLISTPYKNQLRDPGSGGIIAEENAYFNSGEFIALPPTYEITLSDLVIDEEGNLIGIGSDNDENTILYDWAGDEPPMIHSHFFPFGMNRFDGKISYWGTQINDSNVIASLWIGDEEFLYYSEESYEAYMVDFIFHNGSYYALVVSFTSGSNSQIYLSIYKDHEFLNRIEVGDFTGFEKFEIVKDDFYLIGLESIENDGAVYKNGVEAIYPKQGGGYVVGTLEVTKRELEYLWYLLAR